MPKIIYKYPFHFGGVAEIRIGHPVFVAAQFPEDSAPTIWVEHDWEDLSSDSVHYERYSLYGTGHNVPDNMEYIGSAICAQGTLVWHVYRQKRPV